MSWFQSLIGFFTGKLASGYNFREHMAELSRETGIEMPIARKRHAFFLLWREFVAGNHPDDVFTDENYQDFITLFEGERKRITIFTPYNSREIKLCVLSDIHFAPGEISAELKRKALLRFVSIPECKIAVSDWDDHSQFHIEISLTPSQRPSRK